jgi:hypothetical protein
VLEKRGLLNHR